MSRKSNGSPIGLSNTAVLARRKQYGKNSLLEEKTIATFGRPDMLINDAGLAVFALFAQYNGTHPRWYTYDAGMPLLGCVRIPRSHAG
jgi:hypothetical protein